MPSDNNAEYDKLFEFSDNLLKTLELDMHKK